MGREVGKVHRQVPTPAPWPTAAPVAICAYAVHTGNFIIPCQAHTKPGISPKLYLSLFLGASAEQTIHYFPEGKKSPSQSRAGEGSRALQHRLLPGSCRGLPPAPAVVQSQHQRKGRAAGFSISP